MPGQEEEDGCSCEETGPRQLIPQEKLHQFYHTRPAHADSTVMHDAIISKPYVSRKCL